MRPSRLCERSTFFSELPQSCVQCAHVMLVVFCITTPRDIAPLETTPHQRGESPSTHQPRHPGALFNPARSRSSAHCQWACFCKRPAWQVTGGDCVTGGQFQTVYTCIVVCFMCQGHCCSQGDRFISRFPHIIHRMSMQWSSRLGASTHND